MPEDMPDTMPEDMSDRMPEDLPVTKRIDVMVGITWSKVFLFVQGTVRLRTDPVVCPDSTSAWNLQVRASVKMSTHLPIWLPAYLSIDLFVCLFFCVCHCLSIWSRYQLPFSYLRSGRVWSYSIYSILSSLFFSLSVFIYYHHVSKHGSMDVDTPCSARNMAQQVDASCTQVAFFGRDSSSVQKPCWLIIIGYYRGLYYPIYWYNLIYIYIYLYIFIIYIFYYIYIYAQYIIIKGSLEVKLPTIWTDEKQSWAEAGRREEQKREDQRRERVRQKKMQVCEKVEKLRFTVFFQWFVAPEGRKEGSLKRRVRSQLARWEMKNCTPLWREAHFEVKKLKAPHVRRCFWS